MAPWSPRPASCRHAVMPSDARPGVHRTPGGCGAGRRRWARCVAFQPLPLPQPSKATRGPAPLGRLLPRWPLGPQLCTQSQAAHVNEFVAGHAPFVPDECPQQGGGVWEATRSGLPPEFSHKTGGGQGSGAAAGGGGAPEPRPGGTAAGSPHPPVPHTPGPSQVASDKQGSVRPARPLEFSAQTEDQRPLGD